MSQPPPTESTAQATGLIDAFEPETGLVTAGALALLFLARLLLGWLTSRRRISSFLSHSILLGLTVVALVAVTLTLRDPVRDQTLKFLGIVLSAVLAFASTTLVGNGLAGVMLRTQGHFRGGDWVSVGDSFGQVAHRGLFFTTIQNELRDLVTLPNTYVATHPVTVIAEPTYISAQVSLGYDVARTRVERLLLEAATSAGLEKPYVYVLELGDFSVLYRVSGKLKKTDELLTSKSNLKRLVLDALHEGDVEIVSPAFMNQRVLPQERVFIPPKERRLEPAIASPAPEADTFDKGRQARTLEQLEDALRAADERVAELRRQLDSGGSEERRPELERALEKLERGRERVSREIEEKRAESAAKK